jgi:sugar/nucleoside kinase (ribokinase family)
MVTQSNSVCVIGSFSVDSISIVGQNKHFHNLGGAVTYTSLAVKNLGESVSVVSRVGGDFPEAYLVRLREEGIDVSMVKRYMQEITTHFDLSYSSNFSVRNLKLTCSGHPISPEDIPKDLRAKIIHVAPIANEINCETMQRLRVLRGFIFRSSRVFTKL